MFKKLKSMFTMDPLTENDHDPANPVATASAALMIEAASMDGDYGPEERELIAGLVEERYGLKGSKLKETLDTAEHTVRQSTETFGYTRRLKDSLDYEERVEMIEMLWEVAYADGSLHDFEAGLMRKVAGLLYVLDADSGAARKRVLERRGIEAS